MWKDKDPRCQYIKSIHQHIWNWGAPEKRYQTKKKYDLCAITFSRDDRVLECTLPPKYWLSLYVVLQYLWHRNHILHWNNNPIEKNEAENYINQFAIQSYICMFVIWYVHMLPPICIRFVRFILLGSSWQSHSSCNFSSTRVQMRNINGQ